MTFHITPNWYPSLHDIKPNPNSPLTNTLSPPKVFIGPLTPKEINYQHIRSMLQYTQSAKKKTTDDKEKITKDLEIALMRLRVGGGEGRDGRETMRKVVVLEKTMSVHENYEKHLDTCAVPLRIKEEELRSILKREAWENGNPDYYEGCDFWFEPEPEDEEVLYDDGLEEIDGMEGLEIDAWSDDEDTEM
ncbi:c0c41883-d35e-448e-ae24-b7a54985a909-CDS [Sclerotinia trifoliorum]|uniref:C0c41883-d35e-448e-ae24-b7a54985a909-CDS n=1 Tax=Sclerotinia trifoliorum TaxID=28548 RepID=A0A8H2ZNL2_9HELO|nr:c0c41883-d35e-448e-ae24-b7a54985a909-CDS [Sclerotinia trifoliorum]